MDILRYQADYDEPESEDLEEEEGLEDDEFEDDEE